MSLSPERREKFISRLADEEFDLLIIGGGINGAGAARDAASRGMRVAVVEAEDFASGTSSRSSKLVHGGIRYLENLEFGLVFEALNERQKLFEMAPHLVHPLRFVIPLYQGGRVGMFKMGLGMWLYDALSFFEAPETHERLSPEEALAIEPTLKRDGLLGAYTYYDAYMDDDRLVIETLRSAADHGAVVCNYVEARRRIETGERLKASGMDAFNPKIECFDRRSNRTVTVRARHILSTVGPWTDLVAPNLVSGWRNILRPSKGIHLTFSRERLPLRDAVVMAAESRIVFGIPRHEMVIVGTTDTDYAGDPRDVRSERVDVDYLLGVIANYFPGAGITEKDIIASYAGVRPLVDDGAVTESKTSREHYIASDPSGVTFVAGGKYTTYRRIAEEAISAVLEFFPLEERVRFARGSTCNPLNDQIDEESYRARLDWLPELMQQSGLSLKEAALLLNRHGREALRIAAKFATKDAAVGGPEHLRLEALHAIEETMCLSLLDFYLRRYPLFLSRSDHGFEFAAFLAEVFAKRLRWTKDEQKAQIDALQNHLQHEMAWRS